MGFVYPVFYTSIRAEYFIQYFIQNTDSYITQTQFVPAFRGWIRLWLEIKLTRDFRRKFMAFLKNFLKKFLKIFLKKEFELSEWNSNL